MSIFLARGRALPLGHTHIMGILNITPDSFSDGGQFLDPAAAVSRAKEMEQEGAAVVDIGGQSTRPGAEKLPPETEWARIAPVLEAVLAETGLLVSVDTFHPKVAEKAAALGAHILNDVSGFSPEMWKIAAKYGCGCVVVYPGDPADTAGSGRDILQTVRVFFEQKEQEAAAYGIPAEHLCFDPGIGFGKSFEENLTLLANPGALKLPGVALLMAASRKRVVAGTLAGTLAAHTVSALYGADILRAHDVKEAVQAAKTLDALRAAHRTPRRETIRIKGLEIFAYHGVNPEEKENGQPFVLDVAMEADVSRAAAADDLNETVNYAAVRKAVQAAFTAEKFDLIERAAQVVCDAVLAGFPRVQSVTVEVKKPFAPINAKFDYVSVEITRCRP